MFLNMFWIIFFWLWVICCLVLVFFIEDIVECRLCVMVFRRKWSLIVCRMIMDFCSGVVSFKLKYNGRMLDF